MALVNVEGTGMMGVPGVANRLFGALREVGVSVVMISQASSEHSICFAIPETQAALARKTVERAFFAELHHNQIQKIDVTGELQHPRRGGRQHGRSPRYRRKVFQRARKGAGQYSRHRARLVGKEHLNGD